MTKKTVELEARWRAAWPEALAAWSRFTKLPPPVYCHDAEDRERVGLSGSFAAIRLVDHVVMIGLDEALESGVQDFPLEILAHEIGHHVFAPGDLVDHAKLYARLRSGLPGFEFAVPQVANLYTDLLINDRLQRTAGLDMLGVFRKLTAEQDQDSHPVWKVYLRTYESLWSAVGELIPVEHVPPEMAADASILARLIRVYSRSWLDGAAPFAMVLLRYLEQQRQRVDAPWLDTLAAGTGAVIPDGLATFGEDDEANIDPWSDPRLNGMGSSLDPNYDATGREEVGGQKNTYRTPSSYVELMKSIGVEVSEKEMVNRYYREQAIPHLVPFPSRESQMAKDPLPEGLETWDLGAPLNQIDWTSTVVRSPLIIPGLTTVERVFGTTEGSTPERTPVDLYLGVDCSGSMGNPAQRTSFPVIAGAVVVLSAFRAGAASMVELSGSPGEHASTDGFVTDETQAMTILTSYLGTGYAYGIERLQASIIEPGPRATPVHLLIVSDSDMFRMIADHRTGWDIMRQSVEIAGGGATMVLELHSDHWADQIELIEGAGWSVHCVSSREELVSFARAFARTHYEAAS